jgi:hypothetical protein
MIENYKKPQKTLFIYSLGLVEAMNQCIRYAEETSEVISVYYLTNNALNDQNAILNYLDSNDIKAINFASPVEISLDFNFILKIKNNYKALLIAWQYDIEEYFNIYFVYMSQLFDLILVEELSELQRYKNYGFNPVAFNPGISLKYKMEPEAHRDIDVAFVGRMDRHGREGLLSALENKGYKVAFYGTGTTNGFISTEKMMKIYSKSKIVLNLTSISTVVPHFARNKTINSLLSQVKGRIIEGALCGALVLTNPAVSLTTYGENYESYVVFDSRDELIQQVDHYLKNDQARLKIARSGFECALSTGTHNAQLKYLESLIRDLQKKEIKTLYLDPTYHKFISRAIVDTYMRQLFKFQKPDFTLLTGKKISYLMFALFRSIFYYPYFFMTVKIKK